MCILTLSACGGSDDEPKPDTDKPSEADMKRTQGAVPAADLIGKTIEGPSEDGRFAHEITFIDATRYKTNTLITKPFGYIEEVGTYKLRITDEYTYIEAKQIVDGKEYNSYYDGRRLSYKWKDGKAQKSIIYLDDGESLLIFK